MYKFLKQIADYDKKDLEERHKIKDIQDAIDSASKDKQALQRRKQELRESGELVKAIKSMRKRQDAGISKSLRPKIALEFAYIDPRSSQTISDEEAIKSKTPKGKRPKKTFQEFMAQEVPKSENSVDKQIVDIKDILNNS
jgi:hypothetical protein